MSWAFFIFIGATLFMAMWLGSKAEKDILIRHFQFPTPTHWITYLGIPLVWLLVLGSVPALISGFWYGNKLKTQA